MKKIAILAAGLISLFSVSSCYKEEISFDEKTSNLRRIEFKVEKTEDFEFVDDVRSGVYLKPIYTWQDTKVENVNLYEVEYNGATVIRAGEDVTITTEAPYSQAIFSAGFYQSMDIVPGEKQNAPMTRGAGDQGTYSYYAIIAQQKDGKFFIPAEQYPAEATWIDPDCDFLIGKVDGVTARMSRKVIDGLAFVRPAAFSRLAITNLDKEDTKIYKIVITSENALTGSAAFTDVKFTDADKKEQAIEDVTVEFTDGSNTLTMIWPEGLAIKGTTYANFVSILGAKKITKVEIETDNYIYTKTIGKTQTFKANQFTNIALNMFYTGEEGSDITRQSINRQQVKFQQGESVLDDYNLTWDLASGETFVSPVLVGAADGATVTYASSDENVAAVNVTTGAVTFVAAGTVKITATAGAIGDYTETELSYNITVDDSSEAVAQALVFTPATLNYTIGDEFSEPVLSGAQTTITWSSDKPEIATVDATTGVVSFTEGTEGGVVTIKASAAKEKVGSTYYAAAEASYTITVTLPASDVVYYKAASIDTGYDYIIVNDGKALKNNDGSVAAEAVTVTNNTITLADASALLWTAVAESDNELLSFGAFHLTNDGLYLSRISGGTQNSNLELHKATDDAIATKMKYTMWDLDETGLVNASTGGSSKSYYYAYISSDAWVIKTDKPTNATAFFTSRVPQALSFAQAAAEVDMASATEYTQAVSNAQTAVTYSSSDETVAKVDNTGKVTLLKKGSVTITAKAAGSDSYQGAEASYTLSVIDSNSKDVTLNQVTAVADGGMYIMVNNGTALQNNNGAFGAVAVQVASDHSSVTIPSEVDLSTLVWTWESSELNTSYGHYTIMNGSAYLYVTGSYSDGYTGHIGDYGNTDGRYVVWDYTSSQVLNGSSNAKRYLTYNNGWTVPSSKSSHDTYLFEYVDTREAQTLSFAQSAVEIDLASATTTSTQAVSGAKTSVTYSSSDATVASVDNAGMVTAHKKGSVTITATAAANDTYKSAKATYTVNVVDSTPVVGKTYTKVTTAPSDWSGTYLLVNTDNSYALSCSGSTAATKSVAVSDGKIVSNDFEACEITISASSVGTDKYDVRTKDGMYIYLYGSSFLYNSASNNNHTYYAELGLDSNGAYLRTTRTADGGSAGSVNYMRYSSNSFSLNATTSNRILLYKLDDGSTPVTPPATTVTYTKVASNTGSLDAGTYIIINPANNRALSGTTNGNTNDITVAPAEGVLTGDFSANEMTIAVNGSNYTIKNASGQYLYCNEGNSSTYLGYQTSSNNFTLETSTNYADRFYFRTSKSTSDAEYLYYNGTNYFKIGGSGKPVNSDATKQAAAGVYLYKKNVN